MITQIQALLLFYPFDMIKVRLQTSNHIFKYKGLKDAFKCVYEENGNIRGFYSGLSVYLLTYVSNFTIQLTLYEVLTAYSKKTGIHDDNEYK
jgi:hypothetical protein